MHVFSHAPPRKLAKVLCVNLMPRKLKYTLRKLMAKDDVF